MKHKRVAVVRGGPSEEYEVSMQTGAAVLRALQALSYPTLDIIISKTGEWLQDGRVRPPELIVCAVDVVFVALHGAYGEDGTIQKLFERNHIPFTGSRSFPSAVAFNKHLTKERLKHHDIHMPRHRQVSKESDQDIVTLSQEIIDSFGPEYIVKPVASGSSVGTMFVKDKFLLPQAIEDALKNYDQVIVEEYIRGREATCGVLEHFRNESLYVLPPVEIIPPPEVPFFTSAVKYNGQTKEICPARFSYREKSAIAAAAALVHETLGLSQYSRSDFILRDGKVYFLEVNTLPGLTSESLYPKAVAAVGAHFNQLIEHLIETATV